MNPFEMVIGIVLIVTIGSIVRAKYGVRRDRHGNEVYVANNAATEAETRALQAEIRALKERIQVLERIATELKRVPGEVLVTGHSDNKPIATLRSLSPLYVTRSY